MHDRMPKTRDDSLKDTVASRISRALAERIIHGELVPGARLAQDHIAEEFGASHVPVREAFRRLEAQGLVISLPRRGVRVASFDLKQVREVADDAFMFDHAPRVEDDAVAYLRFGVHHHARHRDGARAQPR